MQCFLGVLYVFIATIFLASCSHNKDKIDIHKRIDYYEDTIRQWGGGQGIPEDRNDFANRYIKVLIQAYREDPKHSKTPEYLDRVHMWYSTKQDAKNAVKWATQVIEDYPNYENRKMLLESIATLYDNDIPPRDSLKVRKYYTQLLQEFPAIDSTEKQAIKRRLKYNHLSLEQYIFQEINEELIDNN